MRKSIKKMVGIRVAAALASVILFSFATTFNIFSIQRTQAASARDSAVLSRALTAEVAHYKWASNLSNALYAGTEFTGSIDPTTCVLGQWLYGDVGTDDEQVAALHSQMEPFHKELHASATYVLDLLEANPAQAQSYYQNTIQANLSNLVGMLDQVVSRTTDLNAASNAAMERTITIMHFTSLIGLTLALVCLVSLVLYVLRRVLSPILHITAQTRPLQDGRLDLDLHYAANDELGDLAGTLEKSLHLIHTYVEDINRIMAQLSQGDFDVSTSTRYIGDFQSIESSISSFTTTLSSAIASISDSQRHIANNAEHLSSGAQNLAQGATEQASAVEELYATLDDLTKNANSNVATASAAQDNARLTGEQVDLSSKQMEEMVAAMRDITGASQQISQIIKTIEDIAFQTNILALNAAVEAARAGSAGKGFAVVSSEVRSLAGQSDQAAKATKELIDNAVQAAARGNQIVEEVSATLQRTMSLVTQSNTSIGEIAQAVRGEAVSISQVTEGIGQISAVVQSNSASSQESAAVSSELFEQVRLVQDQIKRFRLKNHR